MKHFSKKALIPYRKMLDEIPQKLKICSIALIIMVFAELFVNYSAISRLMDADYSVSGILRCGIVALFLTTLVVVLGIYGGDRAKRYYHATIYGKTPDKSQLLIAIACFALNLVLITMITYIRYEVGAASASSGGDIYAQVATSTSGGATTAAGFSTPEVVLLAAILTSAAVFSFVLAFTVTDPLEAQKAREWSLVEAKIRAELASAASGRAEEVSSKSIELIEHHCDAIRWRTYDHLIVTLCSLANDPAVATSLAKKAPEIIPQKAQTSSQVSKNQEKESKR